MLKDIQDGVALLKDLSEKTKNLDEKERLVNMRELILEQQENEHFLRKEILDLKEKLQRLEAQHNNAENLEIFNNMYWLNKDTDNEKGPYCTNCHDSKKLLINLHRSDNERGYLYICRTCNTEAFRNMRPVQITKRQSKGWLD